MSLGSQGCGTGHAQFERLPDGREHKRARGLGWAQLQAGHMQNRNDVPVIAGVTARVASPVGMCPSAHVPAQFWFAPGCHMAMISLLVASSRHRNGTLCGTAGGAEPPLTPTDSILTPRIQSSLVMIGRTARVRPGTSLCAASKPVRYAVRQV